MLDGGLGSQLGKFSKGNEEAQKILKSSLWSASLIDKFPDIIEKVHKIYYESGANICLSSSYQASIESFT